MSEAKFTKGEWSIHGDWGIKAEGVNGCIATFEHFDQRPEWAFANANLIATAPEMYEEIESDLESLYRFIKTLAEYSDDWLFYTNEIKRKEYLLAKARGEKC